MRRKRNQIDNDAPGQDSFLDIVANLVGVLIILVVVVGANAGSLLHSKTVAQEDLNELEQIKENFRNAAENALNLEKDNHRLEQQILLEQQITNDRRTSRNRLLTEIQAVRRELEKRKSKLSAEHQRIFDQQDELNRLSDELASLNRQFSSLESTRTAKETIEHYPTPIAKTVFSDEVHYRLLAGNLVHVPMNELINLMRDEWQQKAKKLDTARETIETVGPIGNFRLQYRLAADEIAVRTAYGDIVRKTTEFKRFVLVPTGGSLGQSLDELLTEDSSFRNHIDRMNPKTTTISVWVYPDSFTEFNRLKKWLYERGFQTACWPLSQTSLISGGPSGYRSTAQ